MASDGSNIITNGLLVAPDNYGSPHPMKLLRQCTTPMKYGVVWNDVHSSSKEREALLSDMCAELKDGLETLYDDIKDKPFETTLYGEDVYKVELPVDDWDEIVAAGCTERQHKEEIYDFYIERVMPHFNFDFTTYAKDPLYPLPGCSLICDKFAFYPILITFQIYGLTTDRFLRYGKNGKETYEVVYGRFFPQGASGLFPQGEGGMFSLSWGWEISPVPGSRVDAVEWDIRKIRSESDELNDEWNMAPWDALKPYWMNVDEYNDRFNKFLDDKFREDPEMEFLGEGESTHGLLVGGHRVN